MKRKGHPELTLLSLARPVETNHGVLPAGSSGMNVHVYPGERAYEVEFNLPFHVVCEVASSNAIQIKAISRPVL